ncbi:2-polyprenyl-3-methyl-6-methoxy-1,4-benzoquinone monooxygenase [Luteimonas sp. SDU101]|uniref:2-polyprenyl-3-methyl-6-methoxy-1,4-benzoquinone monooxygenase n=1 Tax=unclassified Luteimonas TaxID=2629088 RepID=UPI003EB8A01C
MPDTPASTLPATLPAPPRGAPRRLNPLDRVLVEAQRALETVLGQPTAVRANPAGATPDAALSPGERRHAAGLMRINHVGEVCAQGLYFGQAAVAREAATREHLLEAAQEETDHLAWCADRLRELDSRPSVFNPLWYGGSYALGVLAGLRGDGWNLGFVVETERQVEAHLDEHLQTLPDADRRSREILQQMKLDEARHAVNAEMAGARILPQPIPSLMAGASRLMKTVAYRL